MKVHLMILAGFALSCFLGIAKAAGNGTHLSQLRCEYLVDPLGIGETWPRLSWVLESSQRGERQIAYQVLVATTREQLAKDVGDLWDSGKVDSNQTPRLYIKESRSPPGSRVSGKYKSGAQRAVENRSPGAATRCGPWDCWSQPTGRPNGSTLTRRRAPGNRSRSRFSRRITPPHGTRHRSTSLPEWPSSSRLRA